MEDIIKKFRFKSLGIFINAPVEIEKKVKLLGFKTNFDNSKSANTVVFVNNQKELMGFLNAGLIHIETDSVLWIAYPKTSSSTKTDINRDSIRVTAELFGITTVSAISIDETWSGLRFRPIDKVGK